MSHTQVPKIELKDGGSLRLTVEVFGFEDGTAVEISGNATQTNGAIATFYHIQNLPPASPPDHGSFLTVIAVPSTESPKFVKRKMITVVGRAAKIWGTVLNEDGDEHRKGIKAVWKAPKSQPHR
jgi:hypothetical protein